MMALADLYRAEFRTSLATMFQYRASLVIWLISQVLDPVIYLIVWSTVAEASGGGISQFEGSFSPGGVRTIRHGGTHPSGELDSVA